MDMDAFYASVEVRDNPALKGKPLIIGSLPQERGVVATCSYEARKFGVRSAMNIKEAYHLCPGGIYMHPNFSKYRQVSEQLREIWSSYATALERIALDEAYLDVTETAKDFAEAKQIGLTIKERIRREVGLSCSVGVAYSKAAAKIASEEKKPDGFFVIEDAKSFVNLLKDRDVRILHTVGEKTAQKLYGLGIRTVGDLQGRSEEVSRLLGKQGQLLSRLAFGVDERRVVPYRPEDAKSISRELTFQEDVEDFSFLGDVLFLLALCVEQRAKKVGLYGKGVTLKVTYGDMKSVTRSRLVPACDQAILIYEEALALLSQVERKPIRLIGVGLYQLSGEEGRQLRLEDFMEDVQGEREKKLEEMFASLQSRYHLDFKGHLKELYDGEILHKTVEYMRRHR